MTMSTMRHGRTVMAERPARGRMARLRQLRAVLREQMAARPAIGGPPRHDPSDEVEEGVMVAQVAAAIDDPLPEDAVYRDEGCEVARSCLACPLALCVLDRPGSPSERRREGRDRLIRALMERGWSAARVAQRFGLSAAQVRRIRAASVGAGYPPPVPDDGAARARR